MARGPGADRPAGGAALLLKIHHRLRHRRLRGHRSGSPSSPSPSCRGPAWGSPRPPSWGRPSGQKKYRGRGSVTVRRCVWRFSSWGPWRWVFLTLPGPLMGLFTRDRRSSKRGSSFCGSWPLPRSPGLSFVYAGSLRGTGDTFYVFLVTLGVMWGVRVFLSWAAADWLHLSLYCRLGGLRHRLVRAGRRLLVALPAAGPQRGDHLTETCKFSQVREGEHLRGDALLLLLLDHRPLASCIHTPAPPPPAWHRRRVAAALGSTWPMAALIRAACCA